jgi:cobalt-zinc-cadmium efflux system outer membrane protein
MRRTLPLLLLAVGCSHAEFVPGLIEDHVAAIAAARAEPLLTPCATPPAELPEGQIDLAALWDLALSRNPSLREAAAEVEAAHGRLIQAGLYPNPRLAYHGEEIGSSEAPKGNDAVEASQEILTAGKRKLAQEAAGRGLDAAGAALLGRKFEVLTRLRRAWYDYLALAYTLQVNAETTASLEESVKTTRNLVEVVKSRPRTDLVRLEALLEQARIAQERTRLGLEAAWRQLAAEVGLPDLPPPKAPPALPTAPPRWPEAAVAGRVQSAHTDLRQAALEAEQARLEFEHARAEAVPNVTVVGGYIRAYIDRTGGANIGLETSIPLWDRKQGMIRERRAKWAQAQEAQRSTVNRLARDAAEAFGRYAAARQQAERLAGEVLPKLEEALRLVRDGFQRGAAGLSFLDIQQAIEALNDARLRLAETRRELWRAVADLEGLMQLDLGEDLAGGKQ